MSLSGTPRAGVTGIVLAGGRSMRFGADKLVARLGERSLLERAVAALAGQATEVVVVLAPGDERALPETDVPVRRAIDPEPHAGPLVGLLAGLEAAQEPLVVVAGGDMPTLAPDVLGALIRALDATAGAEATALVLRGHVRPLPAALRNGTATQAARRLIGDGERSLMSLLTTLRLRRLHEMEWRALDPEAATLFDVDRPDDLPQRPPDGRSPE